MEPLRYLRSWEGDKPWLGARKAPPSAESGGGPAGRTCPSADPGGQRGRAGPVPGGRVAAGADGGGGRGLGRGGHRGCSLVRPQCGEARAPRVPGVVCVHLRTSGPRASPSIVIFSSLGHTFSLGAPHAPGSCPLTCLDLPSLALLCLQGARVSCSYRFSTFLSVPVPSSPTSVFALNYHLL